MRKTQERINKYRVRMGRGASSDKDGNNGCFIIPMFAKVKGGIEKCVVIASDQGLWDHVSVSFRTHDPSHEDMAEIKEMFFDDDEVCMELHVAKDDHINRMPHCLHLWRPQNEAIPLPPKVMV